MPPGLSARGANSRTAVAADTTLNRPFVALDLATGAQVALHSETLVPPAGAADSQDRVLVFPEAALRVVDQLKPENADGSIDKLATDIQVMPLDGGAGHHPVRVNGLVAYAAIHGDQVEVVRRAGTDVSLCSWPVAAAQGSPACRSSRNARGRHRSRSGQTAPVT